MSAKLQNQSWITRRRFLGGTAAAAAGLAGWGSRAAGGNEAADPLFSKIGIVSGPNHAEALRESGIEFLQMGVESLLVPGEEEEVFEARRRELDGLGLPVLGVNVFIRPDRLRCVGPEANHDEVMEWSKTVFRRAAACGVRIIVFGSAGARRLPEGWGVGQADEQFIALLARMGSAAAEHGVVVAVEQLRAAECNYINHIDHAARLVRGAGHDHIRLLADLFHMMQAGDGPDTLLGVGDVLAHVEVAEKEGRTVPGVAGDDFRPYFEALRRIGYRGMICMEGRWEVEQIAHAVATIREQAGM